MEIDPIELRVGNYFEYKRQVLELSERDMQGLTELLPKLKPIPITGYRLSRLNFSIIKSTDNQGMHWQRYSAGLYFNLFEKKDHSFTLYINDDIKLKHIQFIHQLQNVYYDLTGDVLKRPAPGEIIPDTKPQITTTGGSWLSQRRSGPGKYRNPKE